MVWKYLDLVNECVKILLTVGIGYGTAYFGIIHATTFCPMATKFVFYVALPALIMKGLGIGIDLYDDNFSWTFIGVFLLLRALALGGAIVWSWVSTRSGVHPDNDIGQVAVHWLNLTWISTVILGIPISEAVFGSRALGNFYGILAGISSFIFQLPVQLCFLECHAFIRSYAATANEETSVKSNKVKGSSSFDKDVEASSESSPKAQIVDSSLDSPRLVVLLLNPDIWKKIGLRLLRNPVLWAILLAFVLTLSTLGPIYLKPVSDDFVDGLGWIWGTLDWLGTCVSPVSLIAMGVWMQSQEHLLTISPPAAVTSMLAKLVLVPLIMVGLASALDLEGNNGRAAVLIAALPISLASFTLASEYKIGFELLSTNVVLGTALLLPTILVWNLVLDAFDLFPITKVGQ